jgi:cysteine desulfurase
MSVLQPAEVLQQQGKTLHRLPVDNNGNIDVNAFENIVNDTMLVSVMMANNETGVIQDVAPLAAISAEKHAWLHSDASQAAGKIAVNFAASGLHAMTVSSHKLYGPTGAGALIIDKRLPIAAQLQGGAQEKGLRAGTENVAAIVGFGAAARLAKQELENRDRHTRLLRDELQTALRQLKGIEIFAADVERLPNTLQFGVHGFDGETLLMQLDRKGIAVSSGSACTSGKTEASHVLKAMQVPNELALSAVRVSFGVYNTMQDVEAFVTALTSITEMKTSAVMMAAQI